MYYKKINIIRIQESDEKTSIELLILNKDDMTKGKTDFYWIHSSEFKLNGVYYDLIKQLQNENLLFLFCICDINENRLEDEFETHLRKNLLTDKQLPLQGDAISEFTQSEYIELLLFPIVTLNRLMSASFSSFQCEVPSPPPRLV